MAKKTRRKPPSDPIVRFVAFSCRHHPLCDESALDWVIRQIEELKPHYIIDLGDRYEADSASRWPSEYDWELEDEYRSCNEADRSIRRAAGPQARLVFLPGNHDDNLLALGRLPRGLRGLCDWSRPQASRTGDAVNDELLGHWRVPTSYTDCRRAGVFRLGQVSFAHGYAHGESSDRDQAVRFGTPYGLNITGHTHRPVPVTQVSITKKVAVPYWYANAGCLRDLKPQYVQRQNTDRWGHACVVGECDLRAGPAKSPRLSRRWEAETRVLRLYGAEEPVGAAYRPGSVSR